MRFGCYCRGAAGICKEMTERINRTITGNMTGKGRPHAVAERGEPCEPSAPPRISLVQNPRRRGLVLLARSAAACGRSRGLPATSPFFLRAPAPRGGEIGIGEQAVRTGGQRNPP